MLIVPRQWERIFLGKNDKVQLSLANKQYFTLSFINYFILHHSGPMLEVLFSLLIKHIICFDLLDKINISDESEDSEEYIGMFWICMSNSFTP